MHTYRLTYKQYKDIEVHFIVYLIIMKDYYYCILEYCWVSSPDAQVEFSEPSVT